MNTKSNITHAVAIIFKLARSLALFPVVMAVILFVTAGRLDWTWAWVYLGINLTNAFIVTPIEIRTNPVTAAENYETRKPERWDVGSILYLLTMYIALPLVAGLDVRFSWTRDFSTGWHVAGATVLAVGLCLPSWVMITKPCAKPPVPIIKLIGEALG